MKAFQLQQYDKKNLALNCVDLPRPQVAPNEVLIEVKAAGVNPLDNMITRGDVKMITPYALPQTMGNECAGVIVEVGSGVTDFAVGDAVFSRLPISRPGAFAEYVAVPADAVARMPEGLSFEEAASIPLTALTAYQALDLLEAKPGSSIFISGGSGGLGAMAIPLAKARGLKVYTNGNSASRERVMALGADRYLDYREEDYLEVLEPVDYVLDSLGGKELERQMQLLRRGGKIVSLRGMPNARFAKRFGLPTWKRWLFALAAFGVERKARQLGVSYEFLFVQSNGRQLAEVARLIGEKGIQPSVGQVFPFAETNDALRKVASGGASGKVVLSFT